MSAEDTGEASGAAGPSFPDLLARAIDGLENDAQFELETFLAAHVEDATALRTQIDKLERVGILRRARTGPAEPMIEPPATEQLIADRYRVLREIGRGGMGRVLLVHDRRLARDVAVKVAHHSRDASADARLRREALILAQLEHPGIVAVYDGGTTEDGRVFCAMRVVGGRTLHEVIAGAGHGPERTLEIGLVRKVQVAIAACEAIAFAHARGVVHRDLKPSNVMLGEGGQVQVVDWGLAKRVGRPDPDAPANRDSFASFSTGLYETVDGYAFGTPSYCAPEQARGEIAEIDERSDIFGLGAILHHLLVGRPPYYGKDREEVLERARAGRRNDPRLEHGPTRLPPELVAVCNKACAPHKSERYASARELAVDLQSFLEARTVKAYEVGAWAETRKWIQRNKALAAAATGVVLAVAIGGGAFAVKAAQLEQQSNDVLSLLAQADLDGFEAEAERLWPACPELIPKYEESLQEASDFITGRTADRGRGIVKRLSLQTYAAKLAELRAGALPRTETQTQAERESHPRFAELRARQAELHWCARMLEIEPRANERAVEAELAQVELPSEAAALNELAWSYVDPDHLEQRDEMRGLVLARRALAAAPPGQKRADSRDSVAWALFELARFDEALEQEVLALSDAGPDQREAFEGYRSKLAKQIDAWRGAGLEAQRQRHEALTATVAELERVVSQRQTFQFEDAETRWWEGALSRLVSNLEALRDPERGVVADTVAPPFGWGLRKRYEFARTIRDASIAGPEAARRWTEAIAAISSSPRYGGMTLTPQLGLVPIGADRASGLWEFAHLQTGSPAVRGEDGRLSLSEATGLVFVLVPAGSFWMGAQAADPQGHNYDPDAINLESPVREIALGAYFISKYEMTQAQWLRFTGSNPSTRRPGYYPSNVSGDLLHPVESVSWDECVRVLERMELTLPTEAQWERAARGGTESRWWTGDDKPTLRGAANIADRTARSASVPWVECDDWPDLEDGAVFHAPVGSYRANGFGLHDVAGNVEEWCLDWLTDYTSPAQAQSGLRESGLRDGRVWRGGDFGSTAAQCRSAARARDLPGEAAVQRGLRPVRRLESAKR